MDVQKLIDDVERLRALIKSWSAAGPAGALERDLVLEKLRGLYETILLSEPVPACGVSEPHAAVQGEASVPTAGRPGPDAPSESAQEKSSCDVGSAAAGEGHAEKEIPAATAGDVPEAVAEIPAGACAETAEAPQDGCATAAAEALPDGEDSVEQKLFDDEPVTRHRVDKRMFPPLRLIPLRLLIANTRKRPVCRLSPSRKGFRLIRPCRMAVRARKCSARCLPAAERRL